MLLVAVWIQLWDVSSVRCLVVTMVSADTASAIFRVDMWWGEFQRPDTVQVVSEQVHLMLLPATPESRSYTLNS